MSFASDVKAKTVTATGDMVNGRTRIQGIYYTCTGTAALITLKTGGSSGTAVMEVRTPPAAGAYDIIIPDDGILATDGVHATLSSAEVLSVTVLYVGGAPA
jgi:hypothetical protein